MTNGEIIQAVQDAKALAAKIDTLKAGIATTLIQISDLQIQWQSLTTKIQAECAHYKS